MDNEPPQDKICNSGRFLGSLPFARNDMSVGGAVLSAWVVFATLHGGAPRSESKSIDCRGQSHLDSIDESSPLHWVIPYLGWYHSSKTGCICNVAGGRLPPLRFRWWVLPLRPLFLQCGTWYCASSTAYGGPPSPKGKVLAFYLCARCSYSAERGTAPHPPPMAVPLPRRGRFWRSTSAPVVAAMRNAVPRRRLWRLPFPDGKGFLLFPLFGRGVFAALLVEGKGVQN